MIEKKNFVHTSDVTAVNKEQYDEHLKLYDGYVKKINEIDEQLENDPETDDANATYSKFRALKRGETFALDGVILHELYFENMRGSMEPGKLSLSWILATYPDYETWEKDFVATGKASRGWAVLLYDQRSKRLRNISFDAHDVGCIVAGFPVLVMDVYEHAYFKQYGTDKAGYIDAFMKNIDWNVVNRRMEKL